MTQATVTLTDFLLARLDEDEAAVRSLDEYGGRTGEPGRCKEHGGAEGWRWIATDEWDDSYRLATTSIRVLAECEAKRQILDLHRSGDAWCDHCSGWYGDDPAAACPTLRALALPYADHPDYREWTA